MYDSNKIHGYCSYTQNTGNKNEAEQPITDSLNHFLDQWRNDIPIQGFRIDPIGGTAVRLIARVRGVCLISSFRIEGTEVTSTPGGGGTSIARAITK